MADVGIDDLHYSRRFGSFNILISVLDEPATLLHLGRLSLSPLCPSQWDWSH